MPTSSLKKSKSPPDRPRKAALIAAAIGLLALAACAIAWILSAGTVRVGFYAVPDAASGAITGIIRERLDAGGSKGGAAFVKLDDSLPLRDALKRQRGCDLVIAYDGRNLDDLVAAKASPRARAIDPEAFVGLTSSMRKLAQREGEYRLAPLLIDHFEMDCSKTWLSRTASVAPTTVDGLFAYLDACGRLARLGKGSAAERSLRWGLVFPGAEPDRLLQLSGAYIESAYGVAACRALGEAIRNGASFDAASRAPLDEGGHALADALRQIRAWAASGYIHPQWNALSERDVRQLMKMGLAPAVFMTLSDHRAVEPAVMDTYSTSFFPSSASPSRRSLTAPVLCAVTLGSSARLRDLVKHLTSDGVQAALSAASGLAPASSRAVAPDRESDDLRYWTAASEPPYPGLDKDAFRTPAERKAFADGIVRFVNGPAR